MNKIELPHMKAEPQEAYSPNNVPPGSQVNGERGRARTWNGGLEAVPPVRCGGKALGRESGGFASRSWQNFRK